jgi:hypothetical protein
MGEDLLGSPGLHAIIAGWEQGGEAAAQILETAA